jgi:hypothetical protein
MGRRIKRREAACARAILILGDLVRKSTGRHTLLQSRATAKAFFHEQSLDVVEYSLRLQEKRAVDLTFL